MSGARLEEIDDHAEKTGELEEQAEEATEKLKESQERQKKIEQAMQELQDDSDVSKALEGNKTDADTQVDEYQNKIRECSELIDAELQAQSEFQEANEKSASIIEELEADGEDVSESRSIIENRRQQIQEITERLNAAREKLNSLG